MPPFINLIALGGAKMKKIIGLLAVLMIMASSMVYAGGDQNCGGKTQGNAGTTGGGTVEQNRAAAD